MPSLFSDSNGMIHNGSSIGFSFYGINKLSGKIDYKIKTNSYTFSSPAINNKVAYVGSTNGRLYGISLYQKKVVCEFLTEGAKTHTIKIYNTEGVSEVEIFRAKLREIKVGNYQKLYDFYKKSFQSGEAILSLR